MGFDVQTVGGTNVAYASLTDERGKGRTKARLVLVDLASGATTDLGRIDTRSSIRDIAVAP